MGTRERQQLHSKRGVGLFSRLHGPIFRRLWYCMYALYIPSWFWEICSHIPTHPAWSKWDKPIQIFHCECKYTGGHVDTCPLDGIYAGHIYISTPLAIAPWCTTGINTQATVCRCFTTMLACIDAQEKPMLPFKG